MSAESVNGRRRRYTAAIWIFACTWSRRGQLPAPRYVHNEEEHAPPLSSLFSSASTFCSSLFILCSRSTHFTPISFVRTAVSPASSPLQSFYSDPFFPSSFSFSRLLFYPPFILVWVICYRFGRSFPPFFLSEFVSITLLYTLL